MRRPFLSALLFLTLFLAAIAVASDTLVRDRSQTGSSGGCAASCPRTTTASKPTLVHIGERHGNPTVVPHAFVY
ncbi:MAG TPA: hypothetical protein VFQ05_10945 [Candidatus Eisenbacteria bacterium]|nr:hypothetical protein [Candidatus Eisenbacteria bacterium]